MSDYEYITSACSQLTDLYNIATDRDIRFQERLESLPLNEADQEVRHTQKLRDIAASKNRVCSLETLLAGGRLLRLARDSGCADPHRFGEPLFEVLEHIRSHNSKIACRSLTCLPTIIGTLIRVQKFFAPPMRAIGEVGAASEPHQEANNEANSSGAASPETRTNVKSADLAPVSTPGVPKAKKRRIPKDEAEELVSDYLKQHAKGRPDEVAIREVSKATGVSQGGVFNTAAWKVFNKKRNSLRDTRREPRQLPDKVTATVPNRAAADPAEIAAQNELKKLEQEQAQDQRDERRGNKGRSSRTMTAVHER
ncbi:hypothetical protein J8F10_25970 [Gemmata sp. G18]|uniref:Homeobox domain-containing protein n=1 Tax=Gemmata palustris TaxID=2822762 RepID=A0ABS5C0Q0_9BACT|nr:hypothetical protein [Gemmata palustris]MBP3958708.1 hypothetical protein [Gemmata palustris]